jgi:transposase
MVKRRDFDGLERRRIRAMHWLDKGFKQAEVARRLGVSRQSVSRWQPERKAGSDLKKAGRAGRKPKLDPAGWAQVEAALLAGPEVAGYCTLLWTGERVARLITQKTGIKYHKNHIPKLLWSMGWSCQKPVGKAWQRDELAITQWKRTSWPRIKKSPKRKPYHRLHRRKRANHQT